MVSRTRSDFSTVDGSTMPSRIWRENARSRAELPPNETARFDAVPLRAVLPELMHRYGLADHAIEQGEVAASPDAHSMSRDGCPPIVRFLLPESWASPTYVL